VWNRVRVWQQTAHPGRQRPSFQSINHANWAVSVAGCGDTARQKQFAAKRMTFKEAKNEMPRM
jgi:hypothetical protein